MPSWADQTKSKTGCEKCGWHDGYYCAYCIALCLKAQRPPTAFPWHAPNMTMTHYCGAPTFNSNGGRNAEETALPGMVPISAPTRHSPYMIGASLYNQRLHQTPTWQSDDKYTNRPAEDLCHNQGLGWLHQCGRTVGPIAARHQFTNQEIRGTS